MAAGLKDTIVADMTGYSVGRIASFRANPAGADLIAAYRPVMCQRDVEAVDEMRATGHSNMLRMEKMVETHLDEADESGIMPPLKTLDALIMTRMDRFGYGKQTTTTTHHINWAPDLERAIVESGKSTVIEGAALPAAASSPELASSRSPASVKWPAPVLAANIRRRV
jgi:hypothetical protein